jgi:hypothetical protein
MYSLAAYLLTVKHASYNYDRTVDILAQILNVGQRSNNIIHITREQMARIADPSYISTLLSRNRIYVRYDKKHLKYIIIVC